MRILLPLAVLAALAAGTAHAAAPGKELRQLERWMTGSFSSARQAARDSLFLDVRLRARRVWRRRADGVWLYVEQARGDRQDRPYRQRVYRLRALPDGAIESAVFTLPRPERFVAAWRDPSRLDPLTPDSLAERSGCAVVLRRDGDRFAGGTVGTGCASDLRGAAYVTSEVVVDRHGLITLDRGYDAAGRQVWGSAQGPYEFRRGR
jgi:hypothetical protein